MKLGIQRMHPIIFSVFTGLRPSKCQFFCFLWDDWPKTQNTYHSARITTINYILGYYNHSNMVIITPLFYYNLICCLPSPMATSCSQINHKNHKQYVSKMIRCWESVTESAGQLGSSSQIALRFGNLWKAEKKDWLSKNPHYKSHSVGIILTLR